MKKKDLLKIIDNDLLDKLFGFCYVRTKDSCESEELCSDIVYALVKAANGEGEIENPQYDKEQAAKAVECGYLYREGNMVYTRILIIDEKDSGRLFDISDKLTKGYFEEKAEKTAEKIAKLTKKVLPSYLMGEWGFVNTLAGIPLLDLMAEELIKKEIITAPKDGIGAEGCWGIVSK